MAITTMVCVLVGILVAGFLGLGFITQWAQVQKSKRTNLFDFLKAPRYDDDEEEEE